MNPILAGCAGDVEESVDGASGEFVSVDTEEVVGILKEEVWRSLCPVIGSAYGSAGGSECRNGGSGPTHRIVFYRTRSTNERLVSEKRKMQSTNNRKMDAGCFQQVPSWTESAVLSWKDP